MANEQAGIDTAGLIARARSILLTPRAEWLKIADEPADVSKLYLGYLLPLAAVSAIALVVGAAVFGFGGMGFSIRLPLTTVLAMGVTQLVSAFMGAFIFALVINALAPTFGSVANVDQAHKLVVYSSTAGLLAGVFSIFPPLGILTLLGLYSAALLYIGLPILMKTPAEKRLPYFVTSVIVVIVLGIIVSFVMGSIRGAFGAGAGLGMGGNPAAVGTIQGKVKLPGGGEVDLGEVQKMTKQIEAAQSGKGGDGAVVEIDPSKLQTLLPDGLPGGFERKSISSASAGAMGAAQAEAVYQRGDASITLQAAYLGPVGALASMGGAMGVSSNKEDQNGFEHVRTVDGRMVTEAVDRSSNTAKYAVVGRKGALVSADGRGGASLDDVRKAVEAVGVERIEALAGK